MSPISEVSEFSQFINEKEIDLPEYIEKLKILLKEDCIPLPPDDGLLTRFIRARKYNLERAHKSFKRFRNNMREKYSDILQGLRPRSFESIYKKNISTVFANRDPKGRHILLIRSRKWDPNEIDLLEALVSIYIAVEGMTGYLETQLNGITIILDLKDLTFYQARQMTFQCIQIVVDVIQDTLPVSFQEIHIINHPLMFNMVYAIAKPLLKQKIRKRLHFHGYSVKSLNKFVSPDILPYNLGGRLTNPEAWDQNFFPSLIEQDEYYKEYLQYAAT